MPSQTSILSQPCDSGFFLSNTGSFSFQEVIEETKGLIIYGDLAPRRTPPGRIRRWIAGSAAGLHSPFQKDRRSYSCPSGVGVQAGFPGEL